MLNYSINEIEGVKVLVVSGSLTADTIETFKSICPAGVTERVSINFENVTLITSVCERPGGRFLFSPRTMKTCHYPLAGEGAPQDGGDPVYNTLIFAQSIDEAKMKIKFFT